MTGSFITSIIEKHLLISLRIILTNVQWSTSRSLLYSLAKYRARYTIGLVHSILYRTYDRGIGNEFSFSFYFLPWSGLWVLLNFIPLHHRQELLLWLFHFELFQKFIKVCTHWKILSSVLIYLYRSWCSMCKQLHRGLALKNSFSSILYAL